MPLKKKAANRTPAKAAAPEHTFPRARKPRTKAQISTDIAEAVDLPRKDVAKVLAALTAMIGQDVAKAGVFNLPGLAKITVTKKKATRARKGINPFTGEPTVFKAKPARQIVKVRPLKALKDVVA